jgi:hypothetical protein
MSGLEAKVSQSFLQLENCGYGMAERQRREMFTPPDKKTFIADDERTGAPLKQGRKIRI